MSELKDKLDLIQDARDNIKTALEEKGQTVGTDIRDYAEAVSNITTGEDLTAELTAQTQKLEELEAILENKTQGEAKPNIYAQLTEPESKNGIWLQTDKEVNEVVGTDKVVDKEIWDLERMSAISQIPYSFYWGSVVSINSDIYLVGGASSQTKLYKYDTLTNTYTKLTDLPYAYQRGCVEAIGTNIYLFGGDAGSYSSTVYLAYKYDTLTDTYTQLTDTPSYQIYGTSSAVIGTDIYLIGSGTQYEHKKLYKYDTLTDTYTRLTDIPYNFRWGSVAAVGTDIYLVGGTDSLLNFYKYDTLTDTYTKLTDLPYSFKNGSVISVDNVIYLFGGDVDATTKITAYKYNIIDSSFIQLDDIPTAFNNSGNHSTALIDKNIYLVGGDSNNTKMSVLSLQISEFNDKSVIILQGIQTYKVMLLSNKNNILSSFTDVYYYTTQDGFDNTIPTYYGDGTQWINFKNPPVEEVEE